MSYDIGPLIEKSGADDIRPHEHMVLARGLSAPHEESPGVPTALGTDMGCLHGRGIERSMPGTKGSSTHMVVHLLPEHTVGQAACQKMTPHLHSVSH